MKLIYYILKETFEWKKAQTSGQQPGPRRAHSASLIGTRIFIFGGGDGAFALNEIFTLDTGIFFLIITCIVISLFIKKIRKTSLDSFKY